MTEQQRRAKLTEAELLLARQQELLEAYDLVLHDLRDHPGVHGHLPSIRSIKAETVRTLARIVAELRTTKPP